MFLWSYKKNIVWIPSLTWSYGYGKHSKILNRKKMNSVHLSDKTKQPNLQRNKLSFCGEIRETSTLFYVVHLYTKVQVELEQSPEHQCWPQHWLKFLKDYVIWSTGWKCMWLILALMLGTDMKFYAVPSRPMYLSSSYWWKKAPYLKLCITLYYCSVCP